MRRRITVLLAVLVISAVQVHAVSAVPSVGLVPAESPAVTEALADGARLAFEQAEEIDGIGIELVVASEATHWSTAAAPAVELAFGSDVVALITPPERATAHLIAQIGSRAHIPVLTTTRARSIGGTGSYWVIPLLELTADAGEIIVEPPPMAQIALPRPADFESAFRRRFRREPDAWAALGYKAGSALSAAVRLHDLDRRRIAQDLRIITPASAR